MTIDPNRNDELSTLARTTACPACDHKDLEFVLRCDLSYGACLHTARCGACGLSFEILTADANSDVSALLAEVGPCPDCGRADRVASLHCSLSTQSCVYKVECPDCRAEA